MRLAEAAGMTREDLIRGEDGSLFARVRPHPWRRLAPLTVDHTVDQLVPVDEQPRPRIALVLLEPPAKEVPVTGARGRNPTAPGHHKFL